MTPEAPAAVQTDPGTAKTLIERWLPVAWDLSAGTAKASQERAMAYMTPECADAYRKNIWSPDLEKQINESGLQSSFAAQSISVGGTEADGSAVVFVSGTQTLT